MKIFCILTLSFFLPLQALAQAQPTVVNFMVIHNGHQRPSPPRVTIEFDGHTLTIPVHRNKFVVPRQISAAQDVTFEANMDGSHIRVANLSGQDFTETNWTLRLSEHVNDDYQWPGPTGVDVSKTCMLEFDSGHEDPARGKFVQQCRSKSH